MFIPATSNAMTPMAMASEYPSTRAAPRVDDTVVPVVLIKNKRASDTDGTKSAALKEFVDGLK